MNDAKTNQALIRQMLEKDRYHFDDLCCVVSILRGEGGCPWDMEQTHKSIRTGMIEECYEVVEAIDTDNPVLLREELGDVLLQLVFHADIEKDAGRFNIDDVAHDECVKMIHRHPHVFGTVEAKTSEQVLQNWEIIKSDEKQRTTLADKLRSIPPMLPALMRASKVIRKTTQTPADPSELLGNIRSALDAIEANGSADAEQFSSLLWEVTSLAVRFGIDAEESLTKATERAIDQVAGE